MLLTHTLTLRLDNELNVVSRILDLLVTLDVDLPDLSLSASDEASLVISKLSLPADDFSVFRRRAAQIPGVRSVAT